METNLNLCNKASAQNVRDHSTMKADGKKKLYSRSCVSGLPRTRRRPPSTSSSVQYFPRLTNHHLHLFLLASIPSLTNSQPHLRSTRHLAKKYPYIPSWSAETCTATRQAETWETAASTLADCCAASFGWVQEDCIVKGEKLQANQPEEDDTPVEYRYIPHWGDKTCYNNEPPPNDWTEQYTTLKECCKTNFDWVIKDCLGDLYEEEEEEESTPELDPDQSYWYPLYSQLKCLLHTNSNPAPDYMLLDPDNELYPTFKKCCHTNFPDDVQECKSSSRIEQPPSRPPASDNTLVVIPISLNKYYYPRYTENKCYYNGEEAPSYMKNDPMTYLAISVDECCDVQFPLNKEECLYNSGYTDDSIDIDGFNAERWKDHYYPLFNIVGCINDNKYDEYMKENPEDFFYTTMELCCSANFEFDDYDTCLGNSVNVYDVGEMEQQSESVGGKGPLLRLDFGGRLYFQNVFIPSGNRVNMIAVKTAMLFAIESVFQAGEYKVEGVVGKNFDGIDLSGLRLLEGGQGQHADVIQMSGLRHMEQGHQQRDLGRMQLFSFLISFTIECSTECGRDSKIYGRQVSLKIAEIFDDAITDGSVFETLKTSMDEQGLIGPFYSATLYDGVLLYEKAELDMNGATFSPTLQPTDVPSERPSDYPSMVPSVFPSEAPTLKPSKSPTSSPTVSPTTSPTTRPTESPSISPSLSLNPTETVIYKFYPNYEIGTCVADNKPSRWEVNFFDTLEECCDFPWLVKQKCLSLGSKPPTNGPTSHPSRSPLPPTKSPTRLPTTAPTQNPTTLSPTRNPTTSSPSQNPATAPPTVAPTGNPTGTASEAPTLRPTSPPTSVPTNHPTNKPTHQPITPCDNLWHISIVPGQLSTCTNSLEYPKAWESNPGLKDKMLLATPEECCEKNFKGKECKLVYACGGAVPDDSTGPDEPEGSCDSLWHVHMTRNYVCTNSDEYRSEWPDSFFHETGSACCQQHFQQPCMMLNECTTTPDPDDSDTDTSEPSNCDAKWHMSTTGAKNTCTNDDQYPDAWDLNPNIAANTLFDTSDICCNKFFSGKECHKIDVCAPAVTTTTTTAAASSATSTSSSASDDCSSNLWHLSTAGVSSTCTNDKEYPPLWDNNEHIKASQMHATAEKCCQHFFPDGVCHMIDICTGETASTGYYPVIKWPGCTNDNNAPSYMKEDPSSFFFESIELCCSSSNFEVSDYDLCLDKSVDADSSSGTTTTSSTKTQETTTATTTTSVAGTTTTSSTKTQETTTTITTTSAASLPPGNCANLWHVSVTGAANTCTNDKVYPDAWNNENIAKSQLFETPDGCCDRFFAGKTCHQINTCPPDDSSSNPVTTTATTTSSSSAAANGPLSLDWDDELIPSSVRFEGTGTWKIDETQPCCRTGLSIHNPTLLPGEFSSMVIEYTIASGGGKITFTYNMGMGTFTFLVDGVSKLSVKVPGGGKKTFEETLESGDHTFTWKYDAPHLAGLPLSNVWVDNINIG